MRSRCLLPFALLLLPAAPPALAQQPIHLGETISSAIVATDPTEPPGATRYKAFVYHGRKGEAVHVELNSSGFEPFVTAGTRVGGVYRVAAADEVAGMSVYSQLRWIFPEDGDLEIHATSANGATGPFTLSVKAGPAAPAVVSYPIALGQTLRGALTAQSPLEPSASPYERYTFTGRRGQTVKITLRSSDFLPTLSLGRLDGDALITLASDYVGGGPGARMVFTLPADGVYAVLARTMIGDTGAFELTLEPGNPAEAGNAGQVEP